MQIPIIRRGGAGSSSSGLNFTVVGGTVQPENPAENTLWVKTDMKIVGWVFSSAQPSAPTSGLVWFHVLSNSPLEFNAVVENTLNVYPVACNQYSGSSWLPVDMMLYRDSEWKEGITNIIRDGVLQYTGTVSETANKGSHYANGNAYVVKTNGNEYYAVYFGPFSLTSSSEIVIELLGGKSYAYDNFPGLIVSKSPPVYNSSEGIVVSASARVVFTSTTAAEFSGVKRLNGAFDGDYYITLTVAGSNSISGDKSGYLNIANFYIE